jgi:hypothetical protein
MHPHAYGSPVDDGIIKGLSGSQTDFVGNGNLPKLSRIQAKSFRSGTLSLFGGSRRIKNTAFEKGSLFGRF